MDLLELTRCFEEDDSLTDLIKSNRDHVLRYIKSSRSSDSIIVPVENEELFQGYDRDGIRKLLVSYLNEEILEWDLDFIFNCLDMLESEPADEAARDVVFNFANPLIGAPICKENVLNAIEYLDGKGGLDWQTTSMPFPTSDYRSVLLKP